MEKTWIGSGVKATNALKYLGSIGFGVSAFRSVGDKVMLGVSGTINWNQLK